VGARAGAARTVLWPVAALGLAAIAYAPLWRAARFTPSRQGFEVALFRPAPMPLLLVSAVALWIAWHRRARLSALATPRSVPVAAAWFSVAAAASTWAALTGSAQILLASAAAILLAFAAAARGGAGCRAWSLPALVLVLGLAIPPPLEAALVWQLQRWAAAGAAALLHGFGRDVELGGALLWFGGHEFEVIDGCSGLRGILILTLVALLVRELFADAGARAGDGARRLWLVVLAAPLLGHALNVVRIAWVVNGQHPEALTGGAGDHTPQGIAVLAAGTAALYALGAVLARARRSESTAREGTGNHAALPWRAAAIALGGLCAISYAVAPFPAASAAPAQLAFPDAAAGWTSEPLAPDPSFVGTLPPGWFVHRRYAKTGNDGRVRTVELLVVTELPPPPPTTHLFTAKLAWPGSGWIVRMRRSTELLPLAREVELDESASASGPEHALGYLWRPRDEGLARESVRSLLALDATPWRRTRPRAVVRLVAPMPQGGPVAYTIAKRALDVFVSDFRDALADL
jgi:exosortase